MADEQEQSSDGDDLLSDFELELEKVILDAQAAEEAEAIDSPTASEAVALEPDATNSELELAPVSDAPAVLESGADDVRIEDAFATPGEGAADGIIDVVLPDLADLPGSEESKASSFAPIEPGIPQDASGGEAPLTSKEGNLAEQSPPGNDASGTTPAASADGSIGDGNDSDDSAGAETDGDPPEDGEEEGGGRMGRRRRRRKRDPFAGFEQVHSTDHAVRARQLTTLSELKRIKRARLKHEGQRVVTDDVKKLKSLAIEPRLPPGEYLNYYVEPVQIEYYIPKESRFATETRFLYIPLVDPGVREEDEILKTHMEEQRFVDLIEVMNEYPVHITDILDSYNQHMNIIESMSRAYEEAESGNVELLKSVLYSCEVMMDYEPTMASLNFLGDFLSWNINWLIRQMNRIGIEFSAADKTVSYLIKMRNIHWETNGLDYDERFEILAALFFEQAFPNRGLEFAEEDYFYDIFDPQKNRTRR